MVATTERVENPPNPHFAPALRKGGLDGMVATTERVENPPNPHFAPALRKGGFSEEGFGGAVCSAN
jgi:hypothetical protein